MSGYAPVRGARVAEAPEGAARVWAPLPDSEVQAVLDEAAAKAHIADIQVHTHAVQTDAADALLQVASDVGASLIVVGSRGMHGARRVLGSVPNKVSHQARCNVLIVSTDGTEVRTKRPDAGERTRTSKAARPPAPKAGVSTSSTTPAWKPSLACIFKS